MAPGMKTEKITYLSLLAALAIIINGFEYMIPVMTPWFKLGLANSVSLAVIVVFGIKEALAVTVLRIFISSLLFGTFLGPSFILSMSGGVASVMAMGAAYRVFTPIFSLIGISLLGAYIHVLAQGAVIYTLIIRHGNIFYILPPMLMFSLITGVINGSIAMRLRKHLIKYAYK